MSTILLETPVEKSLFTLILLDRNTDGDARCALTGPEIHASAQSALLAVWAYVKERAGDDKDAFVEAAIEAEIGAEFFEDDENFTDEEFQSFVDSIDGKDIKTMSDWYFKTRSDDETVEAFYEIREHAAPAGLI